MPAEPTDGGEVRPARTDDELDAAFAVRRRVFVVGQGVPEALERDGRDGEATHLVAWHGGKVVGTARLRRLDHGPVKVERVAVLPDQRGQGWGRRLMAAAEAEASELGAELVVLHAQSGVEGFYRALDYETVGEPFEEAGIPHVEMVKPVDTAED